jgi:hypothetical protein
MRRVVVLGVLLCAACVRDEAASGRIDVQAAANCAPFEYDKAAYDSCVVDEKRRLNAAAINNLSNVTGRAAADRADGRRAPSLRGRLPDAPNAAVIISASSWVRHLS